MELHGLQKEMVEKALPFIRDTYRPFLFKHPSNDNNFIYFHIFVVWFFAKSNIDISSIDFYKMFNAFKSFPFQSIVFLIIHFG